MAELPVYTNPRYNTFPDFVGGWLAQQQLDRLDGIFQLQSDFLLDSTGQIAFDYVGRFEALPDTALCLTQLLGHEILLPWLNKSQQIQYHKIYTPETRDLVAKIYARDIAMFGYDF